MDLLPMCGLADSWITNASDKNTWNRPTMRAWWRHYDMTCWCHHVHNDFLPQLLHFVLFNCACVYYNICAEKFPNMHVSLLFVLSDLEQLFFFLPPFSSSKYVDFNSLNAFHVVIKMMTRHLLKSESAEVKVGQKSQSQSKGSHSNDDSHFDSKH